MDFSASLDSSASIPQESLELVGQTIDNIGSSVWKLTTEIVTHGADKLFVAIAASSDSDSDLNNGRRLSSSSQVWIWVQVWFESVVVLGLVRVFGEDGFEEIHYNQLLVPISY